jgi:hypothetical protein
MASDPEHEQTMFRNTLISIAAVVIIVLGSLLTIMVNDRNDDQVKIQKTKNIITACAKLPDPETCVIAVENGYMNSSTSNQQLPIVRITNGSTGSSSSSK